MNYQRIKNRVIGPLMVLPGVMGMMGAGAVQAQDTFLDTSILDEANAQANEAILQAAATQEQIIQLSDQADELRADFLQSSSNVDSLEVYNAGMRRTIAQQEAKIAEYDESIANAAELQRQIPPLMERMMVALEQFVELDIPFQLDERRERLETVRDTFDAPDVNVAEKFRILLQAYTAENNYGRSMEHYTDTIDTGSGAERDVDLLQVGRIALIYQTKDQTETGMWNQDTRSWEVLDDSFRRPVTQAMRMAQDLTTTEIIELPILAPESAQ